MIAGEASSATKRARNLRRDSTTAENRLWYVLRNRNLGGLKFARQMPIGPYFAGIVCRESGLIAELDGGQHDGSLSDIRRTAFLNGEGYSVLRFWNNEVLQNRNGVVDAILRVIAKDPSPDLRFAPATLCPRWRVTRGVRAAAAATYSSPRRGEGGAIAPGEGSSGHEQEAGRV